MRVDDALYIRVVDVGFSQCTENSFRFLAGDFRFLPFVEILFNASLTASLTC